MCKTITFSSNSTLSLLYGEPRYNLSYISMQLNTYVGATIRLGAILCLPTLFINLVVYLLGN